MRHLACIHMPFLFSAAFSHAEIMKSAKIDGI